MSPTLATNVLTLRLDEIVPSPLNPRRHSAGQFTPTALQALSESMLVARHMALITVRPHPTQAGRYELADGERRWRAAQLAGIGTLNARVEELSDADMLDLMLGGGANQEPLSPMAEAHGYRERMALDGLSQEALAAQLRVSRGTVAQRLALLELPEAGQRAVDEGRLDASVAFLIATVPGPVERAAFAAEVMHPGLQEGPLSRNAAAALRAAKYCRSLQGVGFDKRDAQLVPAAGACTVCRHREGTLCANLPCFEGKLGAARAALLVAYEARGIAPLSAEENARAFPHGEQGLSYKVDFVEYAKPVPAELLKPEVTPPAWADLITGIRMIQVLAPTGRHDDRNNPIMEQRTVRAPKVVVRVGFDQGGRAVELVKVGEAVCAADLNERQIFNEETRVRFGLENQNVSRKAAKAQSEPDNPTAAARGEPVEADFCPAAPILFSRRKAIAEEAERWCQDNAAPAEPFNIVTALAALGHLKEVSELTPLRRARRPGFVPGSAPAASPAEPVAALGGANPGK